MRIEGWNAELRSTVLRLVGEISRGGVEDPEAEVARRTGALPVYRDLSGTLALTSDGCLIGYSPESGETEDLLDPDWRTLALVATAERFPELVALRPQGGRRPCPDCQGTGHVAGGIAWCSNCNGLGRVD